jgi:signal transduction histidine kinase
VNAARVRLLLTITILVMAVTPMLVSLYLLDHALRTSLNLGFSPRVVVAFDEASENLRTLGKLDETKRAEYRAQFDRLQELKQVYSDPEFVKRHLLGSLKIYFGIGLGLAILLSVLLASLLSRQIARNHERNVAALVRERDRVRYLQEISSWQELARMLAHEIKNPLTPIEVLVTSLSKVFQGKSPQEFLAHLDETQRMVGEELQHLKATVNRFSEFARLPQVELAAVDLAGVIAQQLKALSDLTARAEVLLQATSPVPARVDVPLLRQVLANLLRNGIEANPERRVCFVIALESSPTAITIRVENDGLPVPPGVAERMFEPYFSTKPGKENMGLGLAIVKKIVLEHGGDIRYEARDHRPQFVITLPAVSG